MMMMRAADANEASSGMVTEVRARGEDAENEPPAATPSRALREEAQCDECFGGKMEHAGVQYLDRDARTATAEKTTVKSTVMMTPPPLPPSPTRRPQSLLQRRLDRSLLTWFHEDVLSCMEGSMEGVEENDAEGSTDAVTKQAACLSDLSSGRTILRAMRWLKKMEDSGGDEDVHAPEAHESLDDLWPAVVNVCEEILPDDGRICTELQDACRDIDGDACVRIALQAILVAAVQGCCREQFVRQILGRSVDLQQDLMLLIERRIDEECGDAEHCQAEEEREQEQEKREKEKFEEEEEEESTREVGHDRCERKSDESAPTPTAGTRLAGASESAMDSIVPSPSARQLAALFSIGWKKKAVLSPMTGEDVQRLRSKLRAVVAENDNLRAQLRGAIARAEEVEKQSEIECESLRAHAIDQHRIDVAERLAVAGQLDDANRELETLRERSKKLDETEKQLREAKDQVMELSGELSALPKLEAMLEKSKGRLRHEADVREALMRDLQELRAKHAEAQARLDVRERRRGSASVSAVELDALKLKLEEAVAAQRRAEQQLTEQKDAAKAAARTDSASSDLAAGASEGDERGSAMAVVRLKHERDELQQRSERLAEECARLKKALCDEREIMSLKFAAKLAEEKARMMREAAPADVPSTASPATPLQNERPRKAASSSHSKRRRHRAGKKKLVYSRRRKGVPLDSDVPIATPSQQIIGAGTPPTASTYPHSPAPHEAAALEILDAGSTSATSCAQQ
eukprot:g2033.t1